MHAEHRYRYLKIYAADHHAGSSGARALLDRILFANQDEPIRPFLQRLRSEVQEDNAAAERAFATLDIAPSRLKDGLARMGERLGRLKLNGQLTGYSPLSRLLELEGLRAGIAAKVGLWQTLSVVARSDSRLEGFDFEELKGRANRQLEEIDRWQRWAAERVVDGEVHPSKSAARPAARRARSAQGG